MERSAKGCHRVKLAKNKKAIFESALAYQIQQKHADCTLIVLQMAHDLATNNKYRGANVYLVLCTILL